MAAALRSASVPTVTKPVTPASRAAASAAGGAARDPVVVDVAVVVEPAHGPGSAAQAVRRGNSGAPFVTVRPPG